jgi:hypothetical protein
MSLGWASRVAYCGRFAEFIVGGWYGGYVGGVIRVCMRHLWSLRNLVCRVCFLHIWKANVSLRRVVLVEWCLDDAVSSARRLLESAMNLPCVGFLPISRGR